MKLKLPLLRLPESLGALLQRRKRGRFDPPSPIELILERIKSRLPSAFTCTVLLTLGVAVGLVLWLWLNADETARLRSAHRISVKVAIAGGKQLEKPPDSPKDTASPKASAEAPAATAPPPQRTTETPAGPGPDETFPLLKAPAIGMTEESRNGLLPAISPDGRQPWRVYARPFSAGTDKRGRIALVIDRMGLAGSATGQAMQRLPPAVTLAFVPVIDRQEGWVEAARARGHEIILSVPMEPLTYPHDDPGPNTLLLSLDAAHNIDRLNWALGRFAGYIGITSPTGSRFSGDSSAMRPIMDSLKKRGLAFLDVHATRGSVGDPLAVELSVPHARVDRIIDQDPSRGGIDSELSALESIALKNGVAIGLGEPYPTTIERISQWIPLLADKKLMLVPLSATINLQKPQEPTVTHAPEHGPDHASGHAPEHH